MKSFHKLFAGVLLAGVASTALAGPAHADVRDDKIKALEQKLDALVNEIKALKEEGTAEKEQLKAQVLDLKRTSASQFAEVQSQRNSDVKLTLNNSRPTFATSDGKFALSIRSLLQFDSAYYSQNDRARSGTDLSSGSLFRRARIGVSGKAFSDWSYSFQYDLGGSGVEGSTVSDAYIQYDGFRWLKIRTGAYATPQGIDDQTSASDLLFLERAAPAELARSVAGSDGRKNFIGLISYGDDYYAAVSWSGSRAGDAAVFDGQQAAVGRLAYRVYKDADTNVVLSANGTRVFKVADTAASPAGASTVNYQVRPENVVDGTRLTGTGNINASKATVWGVEAAANVKNFYAQAGYFGFGIDRRASTLPNPTFDGWYVQGSWVLTGEPRRYNTETATWQSPRPDKPLDLKNTGIGAWEIAARYSVLDLDYRKGVAGATLAATSGGIRGGKQEAFTVGLNWYPNSVIRLLLDYQHVKVTRLGTVAPFQDIGQTVDIGAARAQLAF